MKGCPYDVIYRTAGNIGGQLNLAVGEATVKFKSMRARARILYVRNYRQI